MKPGTPPDVAAEDLFRSRLDKLIDRRHERVRLAALIDWERFDREWGEAFCEHARPAMATRLIAGLHYLKHPYGLSDDEVVQRLTQRRSRPGI